MVHRSRSGCFCSFEVAVRAIVCVFTRLGGCWGVALAAVVEQGDGAVEGAIVCVFTRLSGGSIIAKPPAGTAEAARR